MSSKYLSVALIALVASCLVASGASSASSDPDELVAFAAQWAEEHDFNGSWSISKGPTVVASGGRGLATTWGSIPIDTNTAFWIGSLSKQFASAAALRLVDEGRLALDTPARVYLSEIEPGALSKDGRECSIDHLLSHRCGLPRDAGLVADLAGELSEPGAQQRLLERVNDADLAFVPGTEYSYSNLGYDLIGLIVQRVSERPYEEFLSESFWRPLGMRHTGITPHGNIMLAKGQTQAIVTWLDTSLLTLMDPSRIGELGASGNVYSTPRDLLTWLHALHHGQVLSASSYAEMIRPRLEDYALGWVVSSEEFGTLIHHNGALLLEGYSSQVAFMPDEDRSVAVLSNRPRGASEVRPLASALLRKAVGAPQQSSASPTWARTLSGSLLFALIVLCVPYSALGAWRLVKHKKRLDLQRWWFSYHTHAVALAFLLMGFQSWTLHPLAVAWLVVLLLGAVRARWWMLPGFRTSDGWKPALELAGHAGALLFLVVVCPRHIVAMFAVLCLAELAVVLFMLRSRLGNFRYALSSLMRH